jgi:hypothetical protein
MLFSGVLMCGMFFPVPNFLGAVTGLVALPVSPGQGPVLAAFALRVGKSAEYSDRFFECGMPVIKGIDAALLQALDRAIQRNKHPRGEVHKKASPNDVLNGKSWIEHIGNERVLHLYGSDYEMGKAQGELLREEVCATIRMFTGIDHKPTAEEEARHSERRKLWIKHVPLRYREEMRGLAEGAGLHLDLVEMTQDDGFGSAWSKSLAIFGSKTVGGKPLLTQSVEFVRFPTAIVVVYHPSDGKDYAIVTCPGCLNGLAGMNRRGIVIAANPAFNESFQDERLPAGFLVREGLRRSGLFAEAVTYLEQARPADYALFMVAGRGDRDCRVVERTPKLSATFTPGDAAENIGPFQPLENCVRRTYQYVDPKLDGTLRFHCGVFALSMLRHAEKTYAEMTRYVQGISRPVSPREVIAWLRDFSEGGHDDYQVVFRPDHLDFWLALAKAGEGKRNGARFQESHYFNLRRLLAGNEEVNGRNLGGSIPAPADANLLRP